MDPLAGSAVTVKSNSWPKHSWLSAYTYFQRYCACTCGFYISSLDMTTYSHEEIRKEIDAHEALRVLENNE